MVTFPENIITSGYKSNQPNSKKGPIPKGYIISWRNTTSINNNAGLKYFGCPTKERPINKNRIWQVIGNQNELKKSQKDRCEMKNRIIILDQSYQD